MSGAQEEGAVHLTVTVLHSAESVTYLIYEGGEKQVAGHFSQQSCFMSGDGQAFGQAHRSL